MRIRDPGEQIFPIHTVIPAKERGTLVSRMRKNRLSGSEGGEGNRPDPYSGGGQGCSVAGLDPQPLPPVMSSAGLSRPTDGSPTFVSNAG
jgi:hypothetical protein